MSPIQRLQYRSLAAFGLLASTLGIGVALSSSAGDGAAVQSREAPPVFVSGIEGEAEPAAVETLPSSVADVTTMGQLTTALPSDSYFTFSAEPDRGAVLRNTDSEVKVRLTLEANAPKDADLPISPTDLVVVLDVSGSMEGEKLAQAKESILGLMANLTGGDRFGLVSYSDRADWTVPLAGLGGRSKAEAIRTISNLQSLGGTNIAAGLDAAHNGFMKENRDKAVPRVVLLSDGHPTSGMVSETALAKHARRARELGYSLTTVGFGEDYNETLMASMADEGVGNYYFVEGGEDLQAMFQGEFEATRRTVVKDVAITLTVPEGVTVTDVAGLPLEQHGESVTFYPGTFYDGQTRELWATMTVSKRASGMVNLGEFKARYQRLNDGQRVSLAARELGALEVSDDQTLVMSSIDEEVWADCVTGEEMGDLQVEVAKAVKVGDKAGAIEKIEAYRTKNASLNVVVSSEKVEAVLKGELQELYQEVEDAFTGEDQFAKQKVLTKKAQSQGIDTRRAGSKYTK